MMKDGLARLLQGGVGDVTPEAKRARDQAQAAAVSAKVRADQTTDDRTAVAADREVVEDARDTSVASAEAASGSQSAAGASAQASDASRQAAAESEAAASYFAQAAQGSQSVAASDAERAEIAADQAQGAIGENRRAADLTADLADYLDLPDGAIVEVLADPGPVTDTAGNGYYAKSGSPGSGSFTKKSNATVTALDARRTTLAGRGYKRAGTDAKGFGTGDTVGQSGASARAALGRSYAYARTDLEGRASSLSFAGSDGLGHRPVLGRAYDRAQTDADGHAASILSSNRPGSTQRALGGRAYQRAQTDADGFAVDFVRRDGTAPSTAIAIGRAYGPVKTDAFGFAASVARPVGSSATRLPLLGRIYAEIGTDLNGLAGSVRRYDGRSIEIPVQRPTFGTRLLHFPNNGQSLSTGITYAPLALTMSLARAYKFVGGDRANDAGGTSAAQHASLVPYSSTVTTDMGETPAAGLGRMFSQALASAGADLTARDQYLLLSSPGQSGFSIEQLSKGTPPFQRLTDDITYGYQRAQENGWTYSLPAFSWEQGETNIVLGTSFGAYQRLFLTLRDDVQEVVTAVSGQTETVHCITYQVGTHAFYGSPPTIALAQLDLALNDPRFIMSTPMYIMPYQGDVHLFSPGYLILGAYNGRALAELQAGRKWLPIHPLEVRRQGRVMLVRFHVPVAPLVLDTSLVSDPGNYGFELYDRGTGARVAIASVSIVNRTSVSITAAADIGDAVVVRYAYSPPAGYTAGADPKTGPRGCLRDSDPTVFDPGGVNYALRNYCPIFEKEINYGLS